MPGVRGCRAKSAWQVTAALQKTSELFRWDAARISAVARKEGVLEMRGEDAEDAGHILISLVVNHALQVNPPVLHNDVNRRVGLNSIVEQARLVELYVGNPLALKIVAETIVELFGGNIGTFLEQGEVIFSSIRDLLDEQFARL